MKLEFFTVPSQIYNAEDFTWVKLTIYNRWGNVVYQNFDYNNDFGGKDLGVADGVYFWVCELYFEPRNETLYRSGNITILSE